MKNSLLSFIASFFIATSPVFSQPQSILITASELIDAERLLDTDLVTRFAVTMATEINNGDCMEEITSMPTIRQGTYGTIVSISTSTATLQLYCMHNLKKILIDIILFDRSITEDQKRVIRQTINRYFGIKLLKNENGITKRWIGPAITLKTINR